MSLSGTVLCVARGRAAPYRSTEAEAETGLDTVEQLVDQIEPLRRVRRAQNGVLVGRTERTDARQDEAVCGEISGELTFRNHRPVPHFHGQSGATPGPRGDSTETLGRTACVAIGPILDVRARVRVVRQPVDYSHTTGADGDQ